MRRPISCCLALVAGCVAGSVLAQDAATAVDVSGRYVMDGIVVAHDGRSDSFLVHNAELMAQADMDRIAGLAGITIGLHGLANFGGKPNMAAATLQGVDNIEVAQRRAKLYEAWVERALLGGRASLRLGLSDLNAEFYQNDSAGLLIAPPFGVGSELAATGTNGPSIFPSTALTARFNSLIGKEGYVRAAIVNAKSGVLGDPNGVDFSFRDGLLLIAEGGVMSGGKMAVGLWRYTERQPDIYTTRPDGTPVSRVAQGAYILADRQVAGGEDAGIHIFARAGFSDGKTTPFKSGFQLGALVRGLIRRRPDSQLSFGVEHGDLSRGFVRGVRDMGIASSHAETGGEITFSDKIAPWLSVQPDLQYIHRSDSAGHSRHVWVAGLRMIAGFGGD
ncbi:MAG: carbohydrate porin [Sphingobium sp.]|nr:carbohydrate porin [Sphingobium sp.]